MLRLRPSSVDGVAYLTSLLDEAESLLPIDTSRVYFYGHSNGRFMSYRMACGLSDRIAAIASLAGSDFATDCVPKRPVPVLQIHGTADDTVAYEVTAVYPGARGGGRWAGRAGCDTSTSITSADPLDVEPTLDGAETTREQFCTGCDEGLDAELWTIVGGSHIPTLEHTWGDAVYDWLSAYTLTATRDHQRIVISSDGSTIDCTARSALVTAASMHGMSTPFFVQSPANRRFTSPGGAGTGRSSIVSGSTSVYRDERSTFARTY